MANAFRWAIHHIDTKIAFLYDTMDEVIMLRNRKFSLNPVKRTLFVISKISLQSQTISSLLEYIPLK